jgi:hypothetical protein
MAKARPIMDKLGAEERNRTGDHHPAIGPAPCQPPLSPGRQLDHLGYSARGQFSTFPLR